MLYLLEMDKLETGDIHLYTILVPPDGGWGYVIAASYVGTMVK